MEDLKVAKPEEAPMEASDAAKALLNWGLLRYDYEAILDVEAFRIEEVYVYAKLLEENLFLPLPPRKSELQLNFRVVDQAGHKLVVLPRHVEDQVYEENFRKALAYLQKRDDLPPALRQLAKEEQSPTLERLISLVTEHDDVYQYLADLLDKIPNDTVEQAELLTLADRIASKVEKYYRPWIVLNEEHQKLEFILIKYEAENTLDSKRALWFLLDKMTQAILGWAMIKTKLPQFRREASSHYRVRPPEGLVLTSPIRWPTWLSEGVAWRYQVQMYLSHRDVPKNAADGKEKAKTGNDQDSTEFRVRATQTGSVRMLVAALFATLTFAPLLVTAIKTSGGWDRATPILFQWEAFKQGFANLDAVSPGFAFNASVVALPLALGLVGVAWEKNGVRSFAVTQLTLGIGVSALIVAGGFRLCLAWAGFIIGWALFLYHMLELLLLLSGSSPLVFKKPVRTV